MFEYRGDYHDSLRFKPIRLSHRERVKRYARHIYVRGRDTVCLKVFSLEGLTWYKEKAFT